MMTEQERSTIDNTKAIGELILINKQTSKDVDKLIKHFDSIPVIRIVALEKRLKDIEDIKRTFMPAATLKFIMVAVSFLMVSYVSYNEVRVSSCNAEDTALRLLATSKMQKQEQINKHTENRFDRYDRFLGLDPKE